MSEDAALLAEIAQLNAAINKRKTAPSAPLPSSSYSARFYNKPYRAPYNVNNPQASSRNKKLVISAPTATAGAASTRPSVATGKLPSSSTTTSSASSSAAPSPVIAAAAAEISSSGTTGWVKSTGGNMSLMNPETFAKSEKARLARPPAPVKPRKTDSVPSSSSSRQVVIDGVTFEFDPSGTKLNRVQGQTDSPNPSRRTSLFGQDYVRTKNGNLLSAAVVRSRKRSSDGKVDPLAEKRERLGNLSLVLNGVQKARNDQRPKTQGRTKSSKPKALCRYYTKTGRCNNALSCPYIHDPSKLSICPHFLRSSCTHTASTCPLSHSPTAHNTPSCVHFQSTGLCRAGDACVYPHIRVADEAKLCGEFGKFGWCERGAKCEERHAWECKEWSEKGTCRRGGKCGLRHVLRAQSGREEQPEPDLGSSKRSRAGEMEGEEEGDDDDEVERGTKRRQTVDEDESLARVTGGGKKSSNISKLINQDDFVQFSTFGGSDDESTSEEEEDEDDDDESVDSEVEEAEVGEAAVDTAVAAAAKREEEEDADLGNVSMSV